MKSASRRAPTIFLAIFGGKRGHRKTVRDDSTEIEKNQLFGKNGLVLEGKNSNKRKKWIGRADVLRYRN